MGLLSLENLQEFQMFQMNTKFYEHLSRFKPKIYYNIVNLILINFYKPLKSRKSIYIVDAILYRMQYQHFKEVHHCRTFKK